MAYLLQQVANALPVSALYAVLAFGYAISLAVTRRADIAYGAIFAFSGHLYLLAVHWGWNQLWLVLPAALALGALMALAGGLATAVLIARHVLQPLVRVAPNALLVCSVGIVLVLMEGARLASGSRELWLSPFLNQPLSLPVGQGAVVTLTAIQIINVVIIAALILIGHRVLARHRSGRLWRAVADDPFAAELLGVNASTVFLLSYLAAGFYAACGAILSTSYYGTMDFGAGLLFGVKVVLIAAAGGRAHPLRAAAGAAVVGLGETLWSGYGPLLWRDLVVVAALVLVLVMVRRERVVL